VPARLLGGCSLTRERGSPRPGEWVPQARQITQGGLHDIAWNQRRARHSRRQHFLLPRFERRNGWPGDGTTSNTAGRSGGPVPRDAFRNPTAGDPTCQHHEDRPLRLVIAKNAGGNNARVACSGGAPLLWSLRASERRRCMTAAISAVVASASQ
jgi:hypothetical protein